MCPLYHYMLLCNLPVVHALRVIEQLRRGCFSHSDTCMWNCSQILSPCAVLQPVNVRNKIIECNSMKQSAAAFTGRNTTTANSELQQSKAAYSSMQHSVQQCAATCNSVQQHATAYSIVQQHARALAVACSSLQ